MSHRSPKPKKRGMKEEPPVAGPPSSSSRKDRKRELQRLDKESCGQEKHDFIIAALQSQKGSEHLGKRKTEILSELPTQLPSKSSLKITADPPPSISINQTRSKRRLMSLDQSRDKSISPERGGFQEREDSLRRGNQHSEPERPKLFGTTSLSKLGHQNSQMRLGSHFSSMSFSEASRSSQPSTKYEPSTNSTIQRVATLPISLPLHLPIPPCLITESVLEFSEDSFGALVTVVKTAWLKFYLKKYAIGPKPGEELQMPPLSSNKFWQYKSLMELAQKPQVKQYLNKHYSRALEDTIQNPGFETKLLYGEKGGLLITAPQIEEGPIKYLGRFGINQIVREKKRWEAAVLISPAYELVKVSLPTQSKEQTNNQAGCRTENVQLGKLSVYSKRKQAIPEESDESGSDDDSDSDSRSGSSSDDGSDSSSDSQTNKDKPPAKQPQHSLQHSINKFDITSRTTSISQPAHASRGQNAVKIDEAISKANFFITKLNNKNSELLNSQVQQIKQKFQQTTQDTKPPERQALFAPKSGISQMIISKLQQEERSHRSKIFNKSPSEDKHKPQTDTQPDYDTDNQAYNLHEQQYQTQAHSQTGPAAVQQNSHAAHVSEPLAVEMEPTTEVKLEENNTGVVNHQPPPGVVAGDNRPLQVKISGSTRSIQPHVFEGLGRMQYSQLPEHQTAVQVSDDIVKVEASEPKEVISVDKKAKQSTQKAVRKMLESAVTSNVSATTMAGSVFLKEAIKNTANDSYSHEKIVGFDTQVGASIPGQAEMVENKKFRRVRRKLSFTITLERDEFLPDDFQEPPEPTPIPTQVQPTQQQTPTIEGGLRFQSIMGISLASSKPALGKRDPLEMLERPGPIHQPVQSDQVSERPTQHNCPTDGMMLEPSRSSPSPAQGIMELRGLEVKCSPQDTVQSSSQQYSRLEEPQVQDPIVSVVEKSFEDPRPQKSTFEDENQESTEVFLQDNQAEEYEPGQETDLQAEPEILKEETEALQIGEQAQEQPTDQTDQTSIESPSTDIQHISPSTTMEDPTITQITVTEEEIQEPEFTAEGTNTEENPGNGEAVLAEEVQEEDHSAYELPQPVPAEASADREEAETPN